MDSNAPNAHGDLKSTDNAHKHITLPPIREVFPEIFSNAHDQSDYPRITIQPPNSRSAVELPLSSDTRSTPSSHRSASPDSAADRSATEDDGNGGSSSSRLRYACTTCNRKFARPSSLKTHQNTHTGERPFTCPVEGCGRTYTVKSNMRRHLHKHNEYDDQGAADAQPIHPHDPYASNEGARRAN